MNRQEQLYLVLGITTLLITSVSPLESLSLSFAYFSGYVALAGVLGTIATVILAFRNLRHEAVSTNWANLFVIAALPFVLVVILTLIHRDPNVHGFSFPAIFLYAAISELSALILLVVLIGRSASGTGPREKH